MYEVTGYKNTGFDLENRPDSLSLLMSSGERISLDPTDYMYNRFLSSISVRANYETVQDLDYLQISNMFYIVNDIKMTSPDVAFLYLSLDATLSLGGIKNLKFLDGITKRYCVKDDSFGKYRTEDELITASQPLKIVNGGYFFNGIEDNHVIIESSVDLEKLGSAEYSEALSYSEIETGEKVVVPKTPALNPSQRTGVYMSNGQGQFILTKTPATAYFRGSSDGVSSGLANARSLGLSSAIISQYVIPSEYIDPTSYNADLDGDNPQYIHYLKGLDNVMESGLNYEYSQVKNKRLLYGSLNEYMLISICSGNSVSFCPEDIYREGETAPKIRMITDPRSKGKPYFRFEYYEGNRSNFFMNCITGLPWNNAPLVWTDKDGSTIDKYAFYSDRLNARNTRAMERETTKLNFLLDWGKYLTGGGNIPTVSAGEFGGSASSNQIQYENQARQAWTSFDFSQNLITPEINFPREEGLRDFIGNGVLAIRYRLSDMDIIKNDKILTMYGYKDAKPLPGNESEIFTSRQNFNYVEIQGASIGGVASKQLRDMASAELSQGIRFWHIKPDPSAYNNNPIV